MTTLPSASAAAVQQPPPNTVSYDLKAITSTYKRIFNEVDSNIARTPFQLFNHAIAALNVSDVRQAAELCNKALAIDKKYTPAALIASAICSAVPALYITDGEYKVPSVIYDKAHPDAKRWRKDINHTVGNGSTYGDVLLAALWFDILGIDDQQARDLYKRITSICYEPISLLRLGMDGNRIAVANYVRSSAQLGHARALYILGMVYMKYGNEKLASQKLVTAAGDKDKDNDTASTSSSAKPPADGTVYGHDELPAILVEDTPNGTPSSAPDGYFKTARRHMGRAADQGLDDAFVTLGSLYLSGVCGVDKCPRIAVEFFKKSPHSATAQRLLGMCECFGHGIPRNLGAGLTRLEVASEYGDSQAPGILGELYYRSLSPSERDATKALHWYNVSAQLHNNPQAMTELAELYYRGASDAKDSPKLAFDWALKAANLGSATAMAIVGAFYSKGVHVAVDAGKSLEWFTKAAKSQESSVAEMLIWACKWLDAATQLSFINDGSVPITTSEAAAVVAAAEATTRVAEATWVTSPSSPASTDAN